MNYRQDESEKPPLFSKWKWWYILVLGNLGVLLIIFILITYFFR